MKKKEVERITREFLENPHSQIKPSKRIEANFIAKGRDSYTLKDLGNGYSVVVRK